MILALSQSLLVNRRFPRVRKGRSQVTAFCYWQLKAWDSHVTGRTGARFSGRVRRRLITVSMKYGVSSALCVSSGLDRWFESFLIGKIAYRHGDLPERRAYEG